MRLAVLLVVGTLASAHTFHRSFAEVNFNSAAGRVEVVCQIHADDLEMLLGRAQGKAVELDRSPNVEMLAAAYVMNQMAFRGAGNVPLGLEWVGMEVSRHFVTVYLEAKTRVLPASMKNTLLLADLPDQFNQVQLKRDGKMAGAPVLYFAGDEWKALGW